MHDEPGGAHDCDCAGHRIKAQTRARVEAGGKASFLASLAPILACALCPACLSAYAAILSTLGISFALTEGQHTVLLGVAVVAALGVAAFRAQRSRRLWPLGLTVLGCGLLVASQLRHDERVRGFAGIAFLLLAMLWERVSARRAVAGKGTPPADAPSQPTLSTL